MSTKNTNYILIVIGCLIAFYANAKDIQNEYLLIVGIAVLMLGIYRLSRTIPSKNNEDDNIDNFKDD